mmetsp:Transcript_3667/g.5042  ORF Transcript_3667/g.5042 Transcript_3667/m.5042 type:complete len:127 (+) Transcript_3667:29-409(+)|eukprot:CAMPEP_0184872508 /NCGR_PEP_ID=MMETSP0580-20130426/41330_1 /TAXON_ID=1118495 /ORGANISM="Dactyliosolen fragilissimus" /LENGTH=126 /DNA_ID=CAMNT_0027375317 /DNA_START=381 /DNA_END=761 /DNA_ORIENTATION=-
MKPHVRLPIIDRELPDNNNEILSMDDDSDEDDSVEIESAGIARSCTKRKKFKDVAVDGIMSRREKYWLKYSEIQDRFKVKRENDVAFETLAQCWDRCSVEIEGLGQIKSNNELRRDIRSYMENLCQ